jgi:hypothetical protein
MKFVLPLLLFAAMTARAQTDAPTPLPAPQAEPLPPPQGKVLFERHADSPTAPAAEAAPAKEKPTGPELTDADRSAIAIAAYDLDARLMPANAGLAMRARLTLRNTSAIALTRIALQVSSSLKWESATLVDGANRTPLPLWQHALDNDADHTGKATEAVFTLPQALAPGAVVTLDTFYSGTIIASTGRLERIGANAAQAAAADWDAIAADSTSLRGFGNVLWYPVATPQLFFGDGAALFQAIGHARLAGQSTAIHLHLQVEYRGEPPAAAYFCGRRRGFTTINDDADAPVASGSGIATADFPAESLGFRLPSLFVVEQAEILVGADSHPVLFTAAEPVFSSSSGNPVDAKPAGASSASNGSSDSPRLAVETSDEAALPRLAASVDNLAPLLEHWFGPRPLSALTVLDHSGQPFEDGPLLVAPVGSLASSDAAPALVHNLTHAWVQTGQPWMDEGLAQFMALLLTEREHGREAAIAQLGDLTQSLALAEPGFTTTNAPPLGAGLDVLHTSAGPEKQPLTAASDDLYYRRKAAAVWWMLRDIAGDAPLQQALTAWCTQPVSAGNSRAQAVAFEKLLEKTSGKDLGWFFRDWVLEDKGLPDLNIAEVTPRLLPTSPNHKSGWLVAVTVRNDGAAAAEVPVVIRSGTFSTTRRLLIPAFSSATDRVLVEDAPSEVLVNDGSTPEVRSSTHTRTISVHTN